MPITVKDCNPEELLIVKETIEAQLCNPCIGCLLEKATDQDALDYCYGGIKGKARCTR